MKIQNGLEIVESVFLALAIIGIVATVWGFSVLSAIVPLTCSLLFNQINRYRLAQQQYKRTAHLKKLFDRDRVLLTQLSDRLKAHPSSASWVLEQWNPHASPHTKEPVETTTDRSLFQSLLERQVLLEQTVQKIQQEVEMVVIKFQRRPELEQIEHLTGVIVDLQQFINELPQWGRLQQQQLIELRDRVESALAEIPQRVEQTDPESVDRPSGDRDSQS
ncbi:hypothetical protein ACL6C3_25175 [Capilliphycus salinus ALCB114379]|uniref:hypothetical protein n=1 Tax=Capilliphycus salinus TaxID=2768948 RepID=UPI0039A59CFC